ncbi:hypothetical protein H2200_006217 [Cladophialophora chaetospira]|uniref:MYND-type domain-containing protein n=1 Tax=Cladophialophora chaetospira TaxID=386627 RepID=A0AA38XB69_9EURO|nr:hypothetical protein H2200_006217 [Cladophialophora chaetospira]
MAAQGLDLKETCIMCPRRGTKVCLTCKDARYCSKECQKSDWKNHKILCASFKDPRPESTKPGLDFRRGLLFRCGNEPPLFVWVETWRAKDVGLTFETFDDKVYFPGFRPERIFAEHNNIQARDMVADEHEKLIFYCSDDNTRDSPNLAIKRFTRGDTCGRCFQGPWLLMHQWSGPLTPPMKLGRQHIADDYDESLELDGGNREEEDEWEDEGDQNLEEYRDVDMRDVRSAADFFTTEYRGGGTMDQNAVIGAAINSPGAIALDNTKSKWSYSVFRDSDEIFHCEGSGIANLLGIPVLLRQVSSTSAPELGELSFQEFSDILDGRGCARAPERIGQDFRNPEAANLMRDMVSTTVGALPSIGSYADMAMLEKVHIGQNGFGTPHGSWDDDEVDTILVARADGLPLTREHLEVLCCYISQRVKPRLAKAVKGLSPGAAVPDREALLNSITRADFLDFFEEMKRKKDSEGEQWGSMPSPYEMQGEWAARLNRLISEQAK